MAIRHLLVCAILGGFVISTTLPVTSLPADAAQAVKKKNKHVDDKKQQQKQKKKYPWGAPNAGWEDRCIFFYDTYDGWIPTYCRPYGRSF